MVKGSNGSRTAPLVAALKARFAPPRAPREPQDHAVMLSWLADFAPPFSFLNVFRYITFRTGGATATALFFVFFFGPRIIAACG